MDKFNEPKVYKLKSSAVRAAKKECGDNYVVLDVEGGFAYSKAMPDGYVRGALQVEGATTGRLFKPLPYKTPCGGREYLDGTSVHAYSHKFSAHSAHDIMTQSGVALGVLFEQINPATRHPQLYMRR